MFKDNEFTPFSDILPACFENKDVEWLRPSEICKRPTLFSEEHSDNPFKRRHEVIKGHNGGFFLAAVAGLTGYPDRFDKVVLPEQGFGEEYDGKFKFRFFEREGAEPVEVVIDDRLPTINGKLIFAKAPGDVFWCALLEKAYAKFRGGYDRLHLGKLSTSLLHLTGQFTITFISTLMLPSIMYIFLSQSISKEEIICCTHKHDNGNNLEYGTACTVTGLGITRGVYMIRVRDVTRDEEKTMKMKEFKKHFDVIVVTVENERAAKKGRRTLGSAANPLTGWIDDYGRNIYDKFIPGPDVLPECFQSEHVQWLRPWEICENPKFFSDTPLGDPFGRRHQVIKGHNEGVFLAAVAGLTRCGDKFDTVVVPEQGFGKGYQGQYKFRFFEREGAEPVEVVIDDRLPTINGKLIFAQAPGDVFWCALLEKAYAKFLGGYNQLNVGEVSTCFLHLTGLPTQTFSTSLLPSVIHTLISECMDADQIICCKHKHENGNNREYGTACTVTGFGIFAYYCRIRGVTGEDEEIMEISDLREDYDMIIATTKKETLTKALMKRQTWSKFFGNLRDRFWRRDTQSRYSMESVTFHGDTFQVPSSQNSEVTF